MVCKKKELITYVLMLQLLRAYFGPCQVCLVELFQRWLTDKNEVRNTPVKYFFLNVHSFTAPSSNCFFISHGSKRRPATSVNGLHYIFVYFNFETSTTFHETHKSFPATSKDISLTKTLFT